ncbi:endonuclease/exonuclease/phosphatase family protein [Paenibacillus sp. LHD-117]|uniref:endonuclease/exonuclease/phosphatase family protein n=1 Tax=Paenibacillus sp. LHD-117 TaxID=3071412 RepID=UPI0027E012F6|nr:endonuclease/exonuclease/phosphatase family protein [Paenibacillus sp. LHD-117]MDQ6420810.1 endonuclease/exonuclease/phosphatase family protein [Paenibacillus sp. LHD-117]
MSVNDSAKAGRYINRKAVNAMDASIFMRVMTYGMHHGKGMDGKKSLHRIAEEIAKAHPDIVALQGMDRFLPRSGFQDQLKRLANLLGMYACFSPSVNLLIIQYGNAILSRYPIISKEIQYIGGSKERRSILIARLQFNESNTVTVINTHLGVHAKERIKQFPILWDALVKLEQPAILAGDFNMEMDDPLMKQLNSRWQKIALQNKLPTLDKGGEIDHIFVNMPTEQAFAKVAPSDASDHEPVIAELRWRL